VPNIAATIWTTKRMPTAVAILLVGVGVSRFNGRAVVTLRVVIVCLVLGDSCSPICFLTALDWIHDATLTALDCREAGSPLSAEAHERRDAVGRRPAEVASKAPVNQERTLRVALTVADNEGIEAVTMRRLARELGVEAASLYHHVNGKEEILDGLVEAVSAEIEPPAPSTDWREAITQRAYDTRAALRAHPWAVSLMASRSTPGPATLRLLEAGIRCFRQGGFAVLTASHAISVVDSYVHGFVLQEVHLPFRNEAELAAMTAAIMKEFPASEFPYLFEMTVEHVLKPGYDYGKEFESGLEVVLDGVAGLLEQ
jgi:AcrR family transcriptional regulator